MGSTSVSKRALLLSGGMDSTALDWGVRPELTVTIDYGQCAAAGEIRAASAICDALGLRQRVIQVDCRTLGSGDMAGTEPSLVAPVSEWWPYRNQLLITLAAAAALQEGIAIIVFGAVSSDGSHADGRLEFFEAMGHALGLQEGGLELEMPAIHETTSSLCRRVDIPFEMLAWSHSCHLSEYACGRCRGCNKHRETMRELRYDDY
jgi:7-cyano-7-deazaguanine synthase